MTERMSETEVARVGYMLLFDVRRMISRRVDLKTAQTAEQTDGLEVLG